ncbi:MAG: LysR substrate-binding domain-containing protein [bacterium]|nr:LysR substrate-binding domain-containing protein [bacterium]
MNLFQLEYFVIVSEELHFARAAERLHVAQPSLSFQIKQLEEELGVRLFYRTTRRVELTHAGRIFLDKVQIVLRTLQDGMDAARRIERGEEGTLTLGYNGYTLYNILPSLLQSLRIQYPRIQVKVREVYDPELQHQLLNQELDAAVTIRNSVYADGLGANTNDVEWAWLPLLQERLYVALPIPHPLSKSHDIQLPLLAKEEFIVMDRVQKPNAYAETITFCQSAGFFPNIAQEALSIEAGIGLVASGAGIAFATDSMRQLRADKVVYVPLTPKQNVSYGLLWVAARRSPLVDLLLQLAQGLSME